MSSKEILEIIFEFIRTFLSWTVVFLVIALIFIFKFKESIKLFLENIASIKVGPFEASQRQTKIPEEKSRRSVDRKPTGTRSYFKQRTNPAVR